MLLDYTINKAIAIYFFISNQINEVNCGFIINSKAI